MGRVIEALRRGMLVAALLLGMPLLWQSEWQLALAVGWPPSVAWCAPAILDLYIASSLLASRDVLGALAVSGLSVLTSHAVYAATGVWQDGQVGSRLVWYAAATCSGVPLLVIWRVKRLLGSPNSQVDVETSTAPAAAGEWQVPAPAGEPLPGDTRPAPPVAVNRDDPEYRAAVRWVRSEITRTGKCPTLDKIHAKYPKRKAWVASVRRAALEPVDMASARAGGDS